MPGVHTNVFGTAFDPSIGLSWFLNGAYPTADRAPHPRAAALYHFLPDSCQASVEVYATATGVSAATTRPIQPLYQYGLDPQGLSAGQTLRVNLAAPASQSCGAVVSFADASGNPLTNSINPLTLTQTLQPGTAAYLDLPSTSIPGLTGWSGGHVPVVPAVHTLATRSVPRSL
ncbi:MAG TPA: hypothetical protein VKX45_16110 [Bryobacteraceae bacterium]|nr:hypothetical protein [Bryobacteraceae bacterium]